MMVYTTSNASQQVNDVVPTAVIDQIYRFSLEITGTRDRLNNRKPSQSDSHGQFFTRGGRQRILDPTMNWPWSTKSYLMGDAR